MRTDWRDSLRLAADLALLGILVTLAALPIVTAGAAIGTGSAALHRMLTIGRWSTAAECWADFHARLVPGLLAGPAVLGAIWLIVVDVAALRRGAVPGGGVMVAVVLVVAALGAGFVALVAGLAGSAEGHCVRRAGALVATRPGSLAAAAGVVLVAVVLAAFVHPALVPVLAGFVLFAVHAVLRRLTAASPAVPSGRAARATGPTPPALGDPHPTGT